MASKDKLGHPLHWPSWALVFIFRLLTFLPWKIQLSLGKALGWCFFHLIRFRRRVVDVNLRLCFPDLPAKERHRLARDHYKAMGIGLFEAGMAWWAPDNRLPSYTIEGKEHLENAITRGGGVLLLSAHFTTLEMGGRLFFNEREFGGLYRTPDNPVIARQMYQGRIKRLSPAIELNNLKGLIRALKAGSIIWYAPDQSRISKFSALLPFFGVPAVTNTATSRIAAMTGAAVLPFTAVRNPDGSYVLVFQPALDNFPTDDVEGDAVRVNHIIEDLIRAAPEQYFWIHRRFKRRGRSLPNPYKS